MRILTVQHAVPTRVITNESVLGALREHNRARFSEDQLTLLEPASLTVSCSWSAPSSISPSNIPTYVDTNPNLVPPAQTTIQNYVTVTVTSPILRSV